MHKSLRCGKLAKCHIGQRLRPILFACLTFLFIDCAAALAHTSEQAFVLLLPTQIYMMSGVAAVALTVVVLAFLPADAIRRSFRNTGVAVPRSRKLAAVTSLLSFLVLVLLVFIGLTGPRDPFSNALVLVVWTLWWMVFLTLQGLFGDLWRFINPWAGLGQIVAGETGFLRLPQPVGKWPAILGFFLFSSFMLADIAPDDPARLAFAVAAYSLYTLVGMMLFGTGTWLSRGECFTVLLRSFAMLSALRAKEGRLQLGLPGWQIVTDRNPGVTTGIFALLILAVGSFDGLNETFWWLARLGINPLEFPGRSAVIGANIAGLAASMVLVPAVFAVVIAIGERMARSTVPFALAFSRFALAVLPITLGYHIAHYLTAFLVNGQYALAAASDPFADGSDYLGLGTFYVTTGFFNTLSSVHTIWVTQASAVVIGHILAIYVSHAVALDLYKDHRKAMLSQIPSALFMIAYTTFGLWLLASPRGV